MSKQRSRRLKLRVDTEDPLYGGMKKLKLSGKELSHIPNDLYGLIDLEVLDLSPEREACLSYRLTEVPMELGRLVNLKVLMLDTNDLTFVPAAISLLQNLERIALSNNLLTSLPTEFAGLKKLKSLHCANNRFGEVPKIICEIQGLEFVDFSDNVIISVPAEIEKLINMHSFLLVYNKIESLPEEICRLTSLQILWLGGNKLRRLPRAFGNLKNLEWGLTYTSSALNGNPLVDPPLDVCRMGSEQITRYFDLKKEKNKKVRNDAGKQDKRKYSNIEEDIECET